MKFDVKHQLSKVFIQVKSVGTFFETVSLIIHVFMEKQLLFRIKATFILILELQLSKFKIS